MRSDAVGVVYSIMYFGGQLVDLGIACFVWVINWWVSFLSLGYSVLIIMAANIQYKLYFNFEATIRNIIKCVY